MIEIFTMVFAIRIAVNNSLGFFRSPTILLYDGWVLVFRILISFTLSEKKAICAPERRKDKKNRITRIKMKTVDSAGVIA